MKKRAEWLVATLLVVACTSTQNPSSSPSGVGSPSGSSASGSAAGGVIVFNRVDPTGIAVYSLDLGTGTERKIREVEDFVTMSPDGSRFSTPRWKRWNENAYDIQHRRLGIRRAQAR
jgi:hypothetical protein